MERNPYGEAIWKVFWGKPALALPTLAQIKLRKTLFLLNNMYVLPEAVSFVARSSFSACINFHYILSNSFFNAGFRHQLTEPLKEQMYWRNASICYLLQFGGVCPMGFLAKGLYVSQEKFTFMREENWGKSLLLDPGVRDTGLLSFCTCEEKAHSYRNSWVSIHLSFFPSVKNYKWNQIFLCQ